MTRRLSHADDRVRIHLWPGRTGWQWSDGPRGGRSAPHATAGRAVDAALTAIGPRNGAVIILEAQP
jgi:hypothetical protein